MRQGRIQSEVPGQDTWQLGETPFFKNVSWEPLVVPDQGSENRLRRELSGLAGRGGVESILAGGTAYSSIKVQFAGNVVNNGNTPFSGQISLIVSVGGVSADVVVVNVDVAPGQSKPVSFLSNSIPQTVAPGAITAVARLVDLAGVLQQQVTSPNLGTVQTITTAPSLTGGAFTVQGTP